MKSFGLLLLFFGIGSIVLNLIGYEFVLLMWIDSWGETVGWVIRGGMIAAGGIVFFFSPHEEQDEEVTETE